MADLTLEQLLAEPSQDQIRERLFGRLNTSDFPVTDYEDGAVVRTIVEATAEGLKDNVRGFIPKIAAGGFSQIATGEWLALLAYQNYAIGKQGASFTTQKIKIWADEGVGPYDRVAGDLVVEAPTGNRYILAENGTIPIGTALDLFGEPVAFVTLTFKAESPGSKYADPASSIKKLITPLPAVHLENVAPTFSDVIHNGVGTGTVTVSGTPVASARYTLRMLADGQAGVVSFEYSLDGAPYSHGGVASLSGVTLPGGSVATFVNAVNPSFLAGDTFTFNAPGSPIVEQGKDAESDAHLQARLAARWPALSENALDDTYVQWSYAASSAVTKVTITPDNTEAHPGRVRVLIAGAVNPVSSAVAAVQAYIDARHPITDDPVVEAAEAVSISATGDVRVYAKDLDRIQTAAQLEWVTYINGVQIGGVVRGAVLSKILMELGAVDVSSMFIGETGAPFIAPSYELESNKVAVANVIDTLVTELFWVVI